MRFAFIECLAVVLLGCFVTGQEEHQQSIPKHSVGSQELLTRHHPGGEALSYHMNAVNEEWQYHINADGMVKKDENGRYFEEYRWSRFVSDGKPTELTPAGQQFRQILSLDPARGLSAPDLSKADLRIIGPITDLLTFYADLLLAIRHGTLSRVGDHFSFSTGTANSWADGNKVVLGEDALVFDVVLQDIDREHQTATLAVHHVPPEKAEVKLPADWMRRPLTDTPNNWVQVQRLQNGKFSAAVGKETVDVVIRVSLVDGRILSGVLDNPVITMESECENAAVTECSGRKPHTIHRHVEISLVR